MSAPPAPPPVPMARPAATRPRGRRAIRVGIVIMVVAALAIAASVASWLLFGKTSTDGADLFTMPGSVSVDLTEGEWALYSEQVDGTQPTVYANAVTVDGPAEVGTKETFGFFSDTTTVDFEGTTYTVFMKLDVPQDGTYDIDVERDDPEQVPVVIAQYPDHDVLAMVVIFTVLGSMLLGTAGLIVLVVGLILRVTGRKRPPPPLPPAPYPTA